MSAFLSGVLKITLITDLTIGLVWLLSLCLRGGSGYRWRKMVWLFLGLRLLIPATISFAEISGQLPLIRVELNGPVNNRVPEARRIPWRQGRKRIRRFLLPQRRENA